MLDDEVQLICTCLICKKIKVIENSEIHGIPAESIFRKNKITRRLKYICFGCCNRLKKIVDLSSLNERIDSLYVQLQQQAIGLQNVYNQFQEIVGGDLLAAINKRCDEFKEEMPGLKIQVRTMDLFLKERWLKFLG